MDGHDIIVLGASAGGIEALKRIARDIPPEIPAALFVVVHIGAHAESSLARILALASRMPVSQAENGAPIERGRIYVAPPDQHMLIEPGRVHLARGPKENRTRPAVNPLFRSAAAAYDGRMVGVILSGALDDGAAGLWEIKQRGGVAVVQDPNEAEFPSMPRNALTAVEVDHCVKLAGMASLLARLAAETKTGKAEPWKETTPVLSALTCPDCNGPLWELHEGNAIEFECRIKHRYALQHLLAAHEEAEEKALWAAVLALEEGAILARRFPSNGEQEKRAAEKRALADLLKQRLEKLKSIVAADDLKHQTV